MSLARIMALATRIIRQVVRDRRTLVLIFGVPIVLMTLISLVLTTSTTARTLVIVQPTGKGSEFVNPLIEKLQPGADKLKVLYRSADQVDTILKNGEVDVALIFPADFGQQVLSGKNPSVQTKLEGSDPNVASAMHDLTAGFLRQLNSALSALKPSPNQRVTGQPVSNSPSALFTIQEPSYLYGGPEYTSTDSLAPVFIGVFSFFFVFLLTSVSFLRERAQGTIERVMVSPLKRSELVMGYVFGFTAFAMIQSLVTLLFVVFVLRVHYSGNLLLLFLITGLLTIGSVNLGIFLSTFARNEFQIIQFIPLVFGLQVFLSGVFWPIAQLPSVLQPISYILPLTYANEALRNVMLKGSGIGDIAGQLGALLVFALLMILLSALTMRRKVV
jgi:ABC-2 type transport system permease protein